MKEKVGRLRLLKRANGWCELVT